MAIKYSSCRNSVLIDKTLCYHFCVLGGNNLLDLSDSYDANYPNQLLTLSNVIAAIFNEQVTSKQLIVMMVTSKNSLISEVITSPLHMIKSGQ